MKPKASARPTIGLQLRSGVPGLLLRTSPMVMELRDLNIFPCEKRNNSGTIQIRREITP